MPKPPAADLLQPFLQSGESLLWAGYQRPRFLSFVNLAGRFLAWLMALAALVGLLFFIGYSFSQKDWQNLESLELAGILGAVVLNTGIVLLPAFYRRLRYAKHDIIYGFTQDTLLLWYPWKTAPARHSLAKLPHLKIFARTNGTFNVSYLEEVEYYHDGKLERRLDARPLFVDAIGTRATTTQLQQLQRAAKAALPSNST